MQSVAGEVRAVSGAGRHLCGGDPVSLRVQSVAGEIRAVSGAGRHLCGGDRAGRSYRVDVTVGVPLETRDGAAAAGGLKSAGEKRVTGESNPSRPSALYLLTRA